MSRLPRFTAALCLGTLAGILLTALYGAWLVHDARLDQAARSLRLHRMGVIAVPSPSLIGGMTWRDDLAAGLFYGLTAGWPLGGVLTLILMGQRKGWWWNIIGAALLFAGLWMVEGGDRDALRYPALWVGCLGVLQALALAYAGRRFTRPCFLLFSGVVMAFLLVDPRAVLATCLFSLTLPWVVAVGSGLGWRSERALT